MFSNFRLYVEDIKYIADYKQIDWNNLGGSKILIIGATGLIGTALVDVLMYKNQNDQLNANIIVMARNKARATKHFNEYSKDVLFEVIEGDITEPIPADQNIDYIINLASNTHPVLYATEPINTINTIVDGTKNVLDLAVNANAKRVINTSSVEIYGENRGDTERFDEDYCGYINCNTLRAGYPEGKRLAEAYCQAYIEEKNIDVVSIRLARVYGATLLSSDTKSTTQFIRAAVSGDDIILKSDGKQEYSFIYVADVVSAILVLLTKGKNGEAYNVANDEIRSFREIAGMLADINGKKVIFDLPNKTEKKGFSVVSKALMDSSKIRKLGWHAKYDLQNGLERTVNILRDKEK